MHRIIVKEGPLVFLRNVLVMEVVAAIFVYALSFLENYEMLYRTWGIVKFIRYDLFLILIFSGFQLVYVSLLFLDWYFSHFEITEKEITKKSGLIFRHRKSIDASGIVSVETYHSPLGRMMRHATIILHHQSGRVIKMKNLASADDYTHIIKQMVHSSSGQIPTQSISSIIKQGEGLSIEFKETLRFDKRREEVSKEIERMVMKTIVAYLNTEGGTLIIGVSDTGDIVGLESDYNTLPKKNRDGFENHFSQLIKTMIGLQLIKYISIKFERINNLDVCMVSVGESGKPAYLRNGNQNEDFFVRVGNSTHPFKMSETAEYIKTHWK